MFFEAEKTTSYVALTTASADSGLSSRWRCDTRCGSSLICQRDGTVTRTVLPSLRSKLCCLVIVAFPCERKIEYLIKEPRITATFLHFDKRNEPDIS